jgi:WXG100 family type VII secretion target
MDSFSVNPAALEQLSSDIGQRGKAINQALENLDTKVSQLRASWEGDAQVAYDTAHAAWSRSINQMNTLLLQIGQQTDAIKGDYLQSDRKSKGRFEI